MMLPAYSSRIVLSVSCAALTLLLAATTCPTFGAPTARAAESLSAADRASLPDTTLIKLKTGRTASLGVLRSEHKLRLQRFADASMLGKRAFVFEKKKKSAGPGTLVPMNFSLKNFNLAAVLGPLPADMLAFCKAARVTACLYLPGGTPFVGPSFYMDYDYLITDAKQCISEGGQTNFTSTMKMLGCSYYYPNQYILKFNPGPPAAQGYPVTHSATCPSRFVNYTVDPRGAVSLNIVNTSYVPTWGPINSLKTCVVRVFVKK
jgi:hypothetical protein